MHSPDQGSRTNPECTQPAPDNLGVDTTRLYEDKGLHMIGETRLRNRMVAVGVALAFSMGGTGEAAYSTNERNDGLSITSATEISSSQSKPTKKPPNKEYTLGSSEYLTRARKLWRKCDEKLTVNWPDIKNKTLKGDKGTKLSIKVPKSESSSTLTWRLSPKVEFCGLLAVRSDNKAFFPKPDVNGKKKGSYYDGYSLASGRNVDGFTLLIDRK